MTRVIMTLKQKLAAGKLLDAHMVERADGFVYAEGWSDAKVHELVRTAETPIGVEHVARMRVEIFGPFPRRPADTTTDTSAIDTVLRGLAVEVKQHHDELKALGDTVDKRFAEFAGRLADHATVHQLGADADTRRQELAQAVQVANANLADGITRRIDQIASEVSGLMDRFAKLIDNLAVNHVADVRHLRGVAGNTPPRPLVTAR